MKLEKLMIGLLVVMLGAFALSGPANAGKPKTGSWFSDTPVNPKDEDNLSTIQFKVVGHGKKLKQLTIYWQCGSKRGYHHYTNLPIPVWINKKRKFKLVGATTPPSGQAQKDFKLKGKFVSRKKARYSMKLKGCGPKTTGKLRYYDS
ncbi:MAG: hypothetical protein IPK93_10265 [Solirubrobacterales bacterium]|nr:hypothetical protein [Solirubrobacterales bacterium]